MRADEMCNHKKDFLEFLSHNLISLNKLPLNLIQSVFILRTRNKNCYKIHFSSYQDDLTNISHLLHFLSIDTEEKHYQNFYLQEMKKKV